jgi:hypothetical protein
LDIELLVFDSVARIQHILKILQNRALPPDFKERSNVERIAPLLALSVWWSRSIESLIQDRHKKVFSPIECSQKQAEEDLQGPDIARPQSTFLGGVVVTGA